MTRPTGAACAPAFIDKDGYFNGIWASLMVFLYNTKQLNKAEAPKSINDLLQPRWKGKMGMDQDADDWLAALLEYYGDEKGKQIARSLGAQALHIRKGRTLVSQLVAAGEFPLQIDAHHHEATALRKAGAPIDYVFPEPFIPVKSVSSLAMASQPPHPHAAALSGRLHAFEKRPGNRLQTRAGPRLKISPPAARTTSATAIPSCPMPRNGAADTKSLCS